MTPDSGAAHVAGMLGIPCVDCFPKRATTNQDVVRWRPWASRYQTIVLDPSHDPATTATILATAAAGFVH